jgi:hypothetical protein
MIVAASPPRPHPKAETVAFIYGATKDAPLEIVRQSRSVNDRVLTMFTVGAALLGATGLSLGNRAAAWHVIVPIALVAAGFGYLAYATVQCLMPRAGRPGQHGSSLWSDAWAANVDDVQVALNASIQKACKDNYDVLKIKNRWMKHVVIAIGVEAALVAVAAICALIPNLP